MKKSSRDRRVFRRLEKGLPECHQMYLDKDKAKLREIQNKEYYAALQEFLRANSFSLIHFH